MNCRRLGKRCREEILLEVVNQSAFDVIALQEISIHNENSHLETYLSYYQGHCLIEFPPEKGCPSVGFLVHRSWVPHISVGQAGHRCGVLKVHLDCGLWITCVTGHLDGSGSIEDFEGCVDSLDSLVPRGVRGPVLLGIDANAVLGTDAVGHDHFEAFGPCRVGNADARGLLIADS